MFHGVVEKLPVYAKYSGTNDCQLRKADFENIIRYCSERFRLLRLTDLEAYKNGTAEEEGVLITFDDALHNFCTTALPVLQQYQAPSTVFVTSDWTDQGVTPPVFALEYLLYANLPATIGISKGNYSGTYVITGMDKINAIMHRIWNDLFEARIAPLLLTSGDIAINGKPLDAVGQPSDTDCWMPASWKMLGEAHGTGLVEIGAHGKTHAPWTWLTTAELEEELVHNKAQIKKKLDIEVTACSYPHGLRNQNTREVVSRHFTYAFANNTIGLPDRMNMPRYNVPYQRPNHIPLIIRNAALGNVLRRAGSFSKWY